MDDEQHAADHRWIRQEMESKKTWREIKVRILTALLQWAVILTASTISLALARYLGLTVGG